MPEAASLAFRSVSVHFSAQRGDPPLALSVSVVCSTSASRFPGIFEQCTHGGAWELQLFPLLQLDWEKPHLLKFSHATISSCGALPCGHIPCLGFSVGQEQICK